MNDNQRLELAKKLVIALEQHEKEAAAQLLAELGVSQHTQLFQEIGKLTRHTHDTLALFVVEPKLAALTEQSMPDAKERLRHVITLTEQATHHTLTVIEQLLPIADQCKNDAQIIIDHLQESNQNSPSTEIGTHQELVQYVQLSMNAMNAIHHGLSDILLAQGYQDITGQIIHKVIDFAQDLEESLVCLIRTNGVSSTSLNGHEKNTLLGPNVPGVDDKTDDVACNQDEVDDLLSSLGF